MNFFYPSDKIGNPLPLMPAPCHLRRATKIPTVGCTTDKCERLHTRFPDPENDIELSAKEQASSVSPASVQDNYPDTLSQSRKTALAILLVLANFIPMVTFGVGMGAGLHIAASLGITEPSQASWIAASYPLTAGAFILMSGRLGSIYGHARVLLLGAAWWILWTLINGFCTDFKVFNVARGLSGIGGAMVVPNAVAIIGTTFPPGAARNRYLGLFGAGAPVGGWFGALMAGVLAEGVSFKWLFVLMAILGTLVFASLALVIPKETPVSKDESMDWVGSVLGISGIIIFNFVWNQAPKAGWASPYEIALLLLSILLFLAFGFWEYRFAAHPIMPLGIFCAPSFTPTIIVVLFSFMSYGTFIWYMIAWQQEIRHWSVLSTAWGLTPLPIFSAAGAFIAAWLVPRLAVQWILAIGTVAVLVAEVLVVTMPEQQLYWLQMFPATIVQSFCPDFIYTAAQIVACNSVGRKDQGVAGSLIGTLQLYATSIGLGFAGIVETHATGSAAAGSPVEGFRAALYFGMGLAGVALAIGLVFVQMPKQSAEGWQTKDAANTGESEQKRAVSTC